MCPFCDSLLNAAGGCEGCGYLPEALEASMTPDRPYDLMPDEELTHYPAEGEIR